MKRNHRIITPGDTWIDGDMYMHVDTQTVTIEAGSRQRAMPCVVCAMPCGSQPCHLIAIVAGVLCPNNSAHLNAGGFFCHARCRPPDPSDLIEAVVRVLVSMKH